MTLLVDVGNSHVKWCWLQSLKRVSSVQHNCDWDNCYQHCFSREKAVAEVFVSCVAGDAAGQALAEWMRRNWHCQPVFVRSELERDGLRNSYDDAMALGTDRWLAMLAAWRQSRRAFCLFDFGTALSVDLVAADGQHQGGWIIAGRKMQLNSFASLSTVGVHPADSRWRGAASTETSAAVCAGANVALLGAVQYLVDYCKSGYGNNIDFYCCGGDIPGAELMPPVDGGYSKQPHLVLRGLAAMVTAGETVA